MGRERTAPTWASLVILGLLAGAAAGLAIAAFDGASRSGTAYTRMREKLVAADAVFFPSQAGVGDADVSKLTTLDEVAAFLVLLAVGAVGHALLTGARHRAHDLAVLRALGITPRQAAACVSWQATIIGIIALVIGVPAGVIIARGIWRLTADSLSFVYVSPWAAVAMLLVVPGALLVCWILAIWPARAAGRRPAAEVLRAE